MRPASITKASAVVAPMEPPLIRLAFTIWMVIDPLEFAVAAPVSAADSL
jgi:hypothetical protein